LMPVSSPDTTVDIYGANFSSASVAFAGLIRLSATFIDSTHLTAVIPAYMMASPATLDITVTTGSNTTRSFSFIAYQDKPVLTSVKTLGNASILEGSAGTILTLQGTGFLSGLAVKINGISDGISVTLLDSTKALASVPASYFQKGGIFPVSVLNTAPSNMESNIQLLTVYYPAPDIVTVLPQSVSARLEPGSGPAEIEIDGYGFRRGAIALFNGTPLSTRYCEESAYCLATRLYATIPAGLLRESGFQQIMVQNPSPTLASSGTWFLRVEGLRPSITSVLPGSVTINDTPVKFKMPVLVTGSNFGPQTQIAVYRMEETPDFVDAEVLSSTQLYIEFEVEYPDALGVWYVQVLNPPPVGGTSLVMQFVLGETNFVANPFLISIDPNEVAAGGPGFTLTIIGTGFKNGAQVQFYTTYVSTTFIGSQKVTAEIPASLIRSAGRFPIQLINPDAGGASNRLYVDVR